MVLSLLQRLPRFMGAPDVMQDWPLMDYLWTGALPQDPDECDRLVKLGETYRAQDDKL